MLLKRIPHIHKNRIHVGRSKIGGSVLSLTFQFFYAVISLRLQFGPIIGWLVVGGFACLEDKWGDVAGSENMCGPIIEEAVMVAKEKDLEVDIASSAGTTEETHCLHPYIPVHISQQRVMDYPVTGGIPVKILGVIFCLVKNHIWHKALVISYGEYQNSTPGYSLEPPQ